MKPSRSIKRRDRVFVADVNETSSFSFNLSNAYAWAANAAAYAMPRPQYSRRNLQPISTHGVKWAENDGYARPVKPANAPPTSKAQSPHPCASKHARKRLKNSSDSVLVSGFGKNLITSRSAFISANCSKSSSLHWRNNTTLLMSPGMHFIRDSSRSPIFETMLSIRPATAPPAWGA